MLTIANPPVPSGYYVASRDVGATDDTTMLQAALTATGAAGGGIVLLPEGTISCLTTITVPAGVTLAGEGMDATVLSFTGTPDSSISAIRLDGAGAVLRDLTATTVSGTYTRVVNLRADRTRVHSCKLRTANTCAISGTFNAAVVYCTVGSNIYGCEISDCDISATAIDQTQGILATFAPGLIVRNNLIHDFRGLSSWQCKKQWGIYISGNCPGSVCDGNVIIGDTGIFLGSGIHQSADVNDYGRTVVNNVIRNIAWVGMGIDDTVGCTVANNTIDGFGYGVSSVNSGSSVGLKFIGNTMRRYTSSATTLNGGVTLPTGTITVADASLFQAAGGFSGNGTTWNITVGGQVVAYTGKTATTFTGCTGGSGVIANGAAVTQDISTNRTFLDVTVANSVVSGNYFGDRGGGLTAIYAEADGITIHGNTTSVDRPRIMVLGDTTATHLVIEGNSFGTTTDTSSVSAAISLAGAGARVANNNIEVGPTSCVGIKIGATNCSVQNNTINGGTRGIWINSSNAHVTGNRCTGGIASNNIDTTGSTPPTLMQSNWAGAAYQSPFLVVSATGNGVATGFAIPHSMGVAPGKVFTQAMTVAASALHYATADATNITITYAVAPANSAGLTWSVWAEV